MAYLTYPIDADRILLALLVSVFTSCGTPRGDQLEPAAKADPPSSEAQPAHRGTELPASPSQSPEPPSGWRGSPALDRAWWLKHQPLGLWESRREPGYVEPKHPDGWPTRDWPSPMGETLDQFHLASECPRASIERWIDDERETAPPTSAGLTWLGVAGQEHTPNLPAGARRAMMVRSTAHRGLVSRYVQVTQYADRVEGQVGWEWYRALGDIDDFCGRAKQLGCAQARWSENWAWCASENSASIDWAGVATALDKAGAWELEQHVPDSWSKAQAFHGRLPRYTPNGAVDKPIFWVSYVAAGDAAPFGSSAESGPRDQAYNERLWAIREALPLELSD